MKDEMFLVSNPRTGGREESKTAEVPLMAAPLLCAAPVGGLGSCQISQSESERLTT